MGRKSNGEGLQVQSVGRDEVFLKQSSATMKEVDRIVQLQVPNRHTFFQLNYLVIGKEPTHQAKMHRCVEELKARKSQIQSMLLEIDELKDKNELIYLEMDGTSFSSAKERDVKHRMIDRRIYHNNKAIDDLQSKVISLEEEIFFFVQCFNSLAEVEPMKDWDDLTVQQEYWNAKLTEDVSYKILMHLPIDIETIRTALALPVDAPIRKQICGLLQKKAQDSK